MPMIAGPSALGSSTRASSRSFVVMSFQALSRGEEHGVWPEPAPKINH
jgi:hypothetical protein